MSKVRVVFLGTPDFAVTPLESMAKDEHFEIVQVVSQPDKPRGRNMQVSGSPVKQAAEKLGLPVVTTDNVNTSEFLDFCKNLKADVAVVIAFGQIVSQDFLNLFPYKAVNVHGSLLPRWRGAAPIQRAIQYGDAETGVALQIMVLQLDAGPVLGTRKIPILPEDTSSSIYEKLKKLSCDLLQVELMDYVRGHLTGQKQDESHVVVAKKIKKEEGLIDWGKVGVDVANQVRAFDVWPGSWCVYNGKQLKIITAKPIVRNNPDTEVPGQVFEVEKDFFSVSCGAGGLKVLEVQPEGKAKMDAGSFLRGYPLKKGEILK
jgi:methionyl-tRNA formyltransferase